MIEPFTVLAEDDDLPRWDVPDELAEAHIDPSVNTCVASSGNARFQGTSGGSKIANMRVCVNQAGQHVLTSQID